MAANLSREELIKQNEHLQRELDLIRGMSAAAKSVSPGAAADTPTNRMYDELFEFLPLPAFEIDKHGYLTRVNARSLAKFGYEPHEVLYTKKFTDVLRQDSIDLMVAEFEARSRGIKSGGNEYVAIARDGTQFEVLIYTDGIFIDGEFQGVRGVVIDISERVAMETERKMLAEQLRHARRVESVGRLAAGVAHDFNNLLSPIIGYSEVVIEQLGPAHPLVEDMQEILASAHSAREITRQLLTFGQKQHIQKGKLELNELIRDTARLFRRLVPESIFIEYQLSKVPCYLLGDSAQLKQILLNLFINSAESIIGNGKISVVTEIVDQEIELQTPWNRIPAGKYIRLMVCDDGRGIDEQTQKHIFEPFFSTKEIDGTGLGLSTVWGISKLHDSFVMVESRKDGGTCFSVWFPPLSQTQPTQGGMLKAPMPANGFSILVVDDDERMCRLVRRLLTQQGYEVEIATGVAAARAALSQRPKGFDVLLADVILPELDGKRLAIELCMKAPSMKVVYMTGYGPDALDRYDLENEPNLLHKPFDAESLLQKVKEILC